MKILLKILKQKKLARKLNACCLLYKGTIFYMKNSTFKDTLQLVLLLLFYNIFKYKKIN